MIGTLIQPELEELIRAKRWDELRGILSEFDPSDVAELIVDPPPEADAPVFRVLPREFAGRVFAYLPPDHQEELLRLFSKDEMLNVLQGMSPDDQVGLLEELPAEVTRRLLETLSADELKVARDLLGYPPGTAARYMTPNYVALAPE